MNKFRPIKNNLIIKQDEAVNKVGKILLPDQAKKVPARGEVVACGPDCEYVQIGDRVHYTTYAGNTIELGQTEFVVMEEEEILAIEE